MKKYALLRLLGGANEVVFDCNAMNKREAINIFNTHLKNLHLDEDGYAKHEDVTFCTAEYMKNYCTLS